MKFSSAFKPLCLILCASLFFSGFPFLYAEENPGRPFFEEALSLESQGSFMQAEGEFMKAIHLEPTNPDYHFELANLYAAEFDATNQRTDNLRSVEKLEQAARKFRDAMMFRPDFVAAHYNLAIVYKRQDRLEEAREELRRVLELDPDSVDARIQLGMIYEDQGFFDEARDEYRKAQEIDSYNPEVRSLLEDMPEHEAMARQRSLQETQRPSSYFNNSNMNRGFSDYQNADQNAQAQAGMGQALPYLAQMLAQQLMGRLRQKDSDE